MNCSFVACENSPSVYKVKLERPSELLTLYGDYILPNVTVNDVYNAFCKYVTSSIEPIGWTGIWRTSLCGRVTCDFQVEVIDVRHNALVAEAVLTRLLSPKEEKLTIEQFNECERLIKDVKIVSVPLQELYVISDDDPDEQYYHTAMIIEHVRFFYTNLWRPWDEIQSNPLSGSEIFVKTHLPQRLDLVFDVKNNAIDATTINRIKNLLTESWSIKEKLDSIGKCDPQQSKGVFEKSHESMDFLDEIQVIENVRLKFRLEDIEREMKLLEDKHMRVLALSVKRHNFMFDSDDCDSNNCHNENVSLKRIHLVAKSFTLKLLNDVLPKLISESSDFGGDYQTPILFHSNVEKAIRASKSGDKIFIFPGIYHCGALPWIEHDLEIRGYGEQRSDIIVRSNDSVGDILLNCNTPNVLIGGITFKASSEMQCIIMVHSGQLTLKNAVLDGTKCARNTLIVLSKAKVSIDCCEMIHENGNGMLEKNGSIVMLNHMKNDTIHEGNASNHAFTQNVTIAEAEEAMEFVKEIVCENASQLTA